jgi:hypothetical protein
MIFISSVVPAFSIPAFSIPAFSISAFSIPAIRYPRFPDNNKKQDRFREIGNLSSACLEEWLSPSFMQHSRVTDGFLLQYRSETLVASQSHFRIPFTQMQLQGELEHKKDCFVWYQPRGGYDIITGLDLELYIMKTQNRQTLHREVEGILGQWWRQGGLKKRRSCCHVH